MNKIFRTGQITVIFFLISCCPDNDQNINKILLTWAPELNTPQLLFVSENLDSMVFKVKKRQPKFTGHDRVCGDYDIQTQETILVNKADTTFQFKVTLTEEVLLKLDSYQLQPAAKNLSAMYNSVSEQFISDDWRDRFLAEINLNGKIYKNVLHIYANNPLAGTSFLEIYYAQNWGLIGFNNFQGTWFYLKE